MTYEQLIARVAQISHRNDLSAQMQNFVNDATQQIETRLTIFLDPPSPGITNDILETQPNLYLYATLVSCYEFINEGVSAEYYYKRWLDEIDYYYITATEGQTTPLIMGTGGGTAENAVANPVYMPKSGGTFTGPVFGLTALQGTIDTQLATTQFVHEAASQLGGVFGPVNSSAGFIPTWADATGELLDNGIDPSTLATDAELALKADKTYVDTQDATKVTGPASSTADYIPHWDGITGKLLKNSLCIAKPTGVLAAGAPGVSGNDCATMGQLYGPTFIATNSGGFTTNVTAKVVGLTASYDSNNCFANNRFTPTKAGIYTVNVSLSATGIPATAVVFAKVYKNGAEELVGAGAGSSAATPYGGATAAGLVQMNGTTDYLEFWTTMIGSPTTVDNGYFSAAFVRSL